MVSMPHGPVLSRIYDAAKWQSSEDDPWYEYVFEKDVYDVYLAKPSPETDELSDYEIGVLTEIYREFGNLSQFELRDLTHRLPEWQDPNGSSFPIEPADILRLEGKSDKEIVRFTRSAEEILFLEELRQRAAKAA
jgi:hypothetical protein